MNYWEGKNKGDYYLCDRCNVSKLSHYEYEGNIREIEGSNDFMRYCDECRNWINLQHYTDKQGNKHTLRSERIIGVDIFP
jgi:hypothetical protein